MGGVLVVAPRCPQSTGLTHCSNQCSNELLFPTTREHAAKVRRGMDRTRTAHNHIARHAHDESCSLCALDQASDTKVYGGDELMNTVSTSVRQVISHPQNYGLSFHYIPGCTISMCVIANSTTLAHENAMRSTSLLKLAWPPRLPEPPRTWSSVAQSQP